MHVPYAALTFFLRRVGSLFDVDVQLQIVVYVPLDLDPDAQSNEGGQRTVRYRRVELDSHHIDVALGWFLDEDTLLVDHLQVLQCVWLLRISDGTQEILIGKSR